MENVLLEVQQRQGGRMAETVGKRLLAPELVEEIREKFVYIDWDPYSGKRIHFDASGGSVRLKLVIEAVARETALPSEHHRGNPGSDHADEVFEKGMEDAMLFVGAKSGTIMPALSGSQACFRIANAIINHTTGKNIVTTKIEHPCVIGACQFLGGLTGKEVRYAEVSRETSSVHVESIIERIDKDTCMLAFNHASNITGAVHDVATIVKEARKIKPDLYIMVDAVQYTPHGRMEVEEWGVDGYFFSPYKVYCVKGIGMAWLSDRMAKLPHWKLPAKPEDDWVIGSPGHQMYAAFSVMVDYLCWLGKKFTDATDRRALIVSAKERIQENMVGLLEKALNGTDNHDGLLAMKHVNVPGLGDISKRLCIVPFKLKGTDAKEGIRRFGEEHGIRLCARVRDAYSTDILTAIGMPDAVRLSACHYNTVEELDEFLKVAASMA